MTDAVTRVVRESLCARAKGICHNGSHSHICGSVGLVRVRTPALHALPHWIDL